MPIVVRAELEKMTQKTPAVRDAEGECMADAGTGGPRPVGISGVRRPVAIENQERPLLPPREDNAHRIGFAATGIGR